jgi:hypothetical protein
MIILKITPRKLFTLDHVFHISDNRINLVFNSLLSKNSFKMVFECDKFILSKSKMFIGKGYLSDDFFQNKYNHHCN